ncbi:pyrroloquinoline quinone precursor peptide PqqA [Ectothiorhodospiraceae bacterium 2226]|nr:pyrroloquinoline quinone precursor peptide PqqA [Ectothiorhodospiraceae bacterium 2226]
MQPSSTIWSGRTGRPASPPTSRNSWRQPSRRVGCSLVDTSVRYTHAGRPGAPAPERLSFNRRSLVMKRWSRPKFENLRYGFEINLYVKVR